MKAVLGQFLRFGAVGAAGFLVDTACVYATRAALGLYWAGVAAYVVAASCNWALNRVWTFKDSGSGPAHRQWARFLAVNLVGFALNRGTYAVAVGQFPLAEAHPVLAIAAGTAAGMFANFFLSRALVFR